VVLAEKCVAGITANRDLLRQRVSDSIGLVTAFAPIIGYENATSVAQEALLSGSGVSELVVAKGLMTQAQVDTILSPENLVTGTTRR
jgi:aspartate ammonia-lyase